MANLRPKGDVPTIWDLARSGDTTNLVNLLNSSKDGKKTLEEVEPEENSTLVGLSVNYGQLETTIMLLDRGADIQTKGDDDWSLLHKACYQGHADIAKVLLDRGVNASPKDVNGWTPLHNACADGNISMITLLLERGADINAPDNDGWTPLHLTCDCSDDESHCNVVKFLIEKGAKIESKDNNGETSLHRACTKGNEKLAVTLIGLKANIHAVDNYGWSVLHIAAAKDFGELIKALVTKGANVDFEDTKGWTALLVASAAGQLHALGALIEKKADVDHCASDFTTPLYLACAKGFEDVATLLIEAGADMEAKVGADELTALMISTGKNKKNTTKLLIKKGANIEAKDLNSLTVLQRAAAKGLIDMVQILLDAGVDITVKTKFGSTALDFAVDRKHEDVADLLRKWADKLRLAEASKGLTKPIKTAQAKSYITPKNEGAKLIADKVAEMGHRRRNKLGVRASLNEVALSDAEAAARIALSLDMGDVEDYGHERLNKLAKLAKEVAQAQHNTCNRDSLTSIVLEKKREALESLPPSIYTQVLKLAEENSKLEETLPSGRKIEVRDLRRRSIAAVIDFDVTRKEDYLTDEEFTKVFKMSKEAWEALPKWKREMKKKELGLF